MSALINFVVSNKKILAPVGAWLLANLITALTKQPQTPVTNELSAALRFLQTLLDRVSLAYHVGTTPHVQMGRLKFNIPGKRSSVAAPAAPVAAPPAAIFIPFFLILSMISSGCCMFHGNCKSGSAGSCVTDSVKQQFPHLLPIIAEIFTHGGLDVNVGAELAKEGITVANDVLQCIVQTIFSMSDSKIAQVKSGKLAATPEPWLNMPIDPLQHLHDAAAAWLKTHGGK